MGRNGQKDVGQTKHGQSNLLDSVNVFSTLLCGQHHVAGGSTLDSVLGEGTETATLAWLVSALEHAIIRGQTKLVGYLEAVVEDVVFEMEAAAWRRGHM
jgi:hypothetical protein